MESINLEKRAVELANLHLEGLSSSNKSGYESRIYCYSLLNKNSLIFSDDFEADIIPGFENYDEIVERFNKFAYEFPDKVEKVFERIEPDHSYEVIYEIGNYRYYFSNYDGYYEWGGDIEFLKLLLR